MLDGTATRDTATSAVGDYRRSAEQWPVYLRERQREVETAVALVNAEYEQAIAAAKAARDEALTPLRDDLKSLDRAIAAADRNRAELAETGDA